MAAIEQKFTILGLTQLFSGSILRQESTEDQSFKPLELDEIREWSKIPDQRFSIVNPIDDLVLATVKRLKNGISTFACPILPEKAEINRILVFKPIQPKLNEEYSHEAYQIKNNGRMQGLIHNGVCLCPVGPEKEKKDVINLPERAIGKLTCAVKDKQGIRGISVIIGQQKIYLPDDKQNFYENLSLKLGL